MGGSFWGGKLNPIHEDGVQEFISKAAKAYLDKFKNPLTAIIAMPSNGTQLIQSNTDF